MCGIVLFFFPWPRYFQCIHPLTYTYHDYVLTLAHLTDFPNGCLVSSKVWSNYAYMPIYLSVLLPLEQSIHGWFPNLPLLILSGLALSPAPSSGFISWPVLHDLLQLLFSICFVIEKVGFSAYIPFPTLGAYR
jgi:hypothetical protein